MINQTTQHIILKISYHLSGLIGFLILKNIRPEFYKNRSNLYMIIVFSVYVYALGPAVFIFSLIALIADKVRKPKPVDKGKTIKFDDIYCHDKPDFFCSFGENGTNNYWCKNQCAACVDGYGMNPDSEWKDDRPFTPNWASKPGDTIKDMLENAQMSIYEFSSQMNIPFTDALKLINAEMEIDAIIANKLSNVLGSSVGFWMNRESNYRKQVAKLRAGIEEFPDNIGKDIDDIANIINQGNE